MAKVRCRNCKLYKGERCEARMKYMNPDTPRYCIHYDPTDQQSLEIWRTHPTHCWPP